MFQSSLATLEFISQLHLKTLGFLWGHLKYSPLWWLGQGTGISKSYPLLSISPSLTGLSLQKHLENVCIFSLPACRATKE